MTLMWLLCLFSYRIYGFTTTNTLLRALRVQQNSLTAFSPSKPLHTRSLQLPPNSSLISRGSSTQLSVLGTDGGLFGIGAPEIVVVVLIGYFVLGPSELYKLTKEIGRFVNNFRSVGQQTIANLEEGMESQLQLEEIRKAKRDLESAFDFRRSVNFGDDNLYIDDDSEGKAEGGISTTVKKKEKGPSGVMPTKRRKVRRKKRKLVASTDDETKTPEVAADLRMTDDVDNNVGDIGSDNNYDFSQFQAVDEREKFQSQMNTQDWNEEIMKGDRDRDRDRGRDGVHNTDRERDYGNEYDPTAGNDSNASLLLSNILSRIEALEEERERSMSLLQAEFEERGRVDEEYFKEKQRLLEEAKVQIMNKE